MGRRISGHERRVGRPDGGPRLMSHHDEGQRSRSPAMWLRQRWRQFEGLARAFRACPPSRDGHRRRFVHRGRRISIWGQSTGPAIVRLINTVSNVGAIVAALSVVLMFLLIVAEVIGRSFLSLSTRVADEIPGYFLVAAVFYGLAYSVRTGGFVRIGSLLERTGRRTKRVTLFLVPATATAYALVLLYFLGIYVRETYRLGTTSFQISETPLWIPQTSMVIGLLVMVLELLKATVVSTLPPSGGSSEDAPWHDKPRH